MSLVTLVFIAFFRIALPQAGHTSLGTAELKDGVFSGSVSYVNSDWLASIADWYKSDIRKSPKNNIEVYERNYFKNFFRVWADHVQVSLATLDRKESGDTVTFSFTFNVGDASELMIDHRAIFDTYADQVHEMTFKMFGKDRAYSFKVAAPTFFVKKKVETGFVK